MVKARAAVDQAKAAEKEAREKIAREAAKQEKRQQQKTAQAKKKRADLADKIKEQRLLLTETIQQTQEELQFKLQAARTAVLEPKIQAARKALVFLAPLS